MSRDDNIDAQRLLADLTCPVQAVSDIYAERTGITRDRDWYLLKIGEELGELHKAYLRRQGRARCPDDADLDGDIADEAADLLAHLLLFAANEKIALGKALERKWFKYLRSA